MLAGLAGLGWAGRVAPWSSSLLSGVAGGGGGGGGGGGARLLLTPDSQLLLCSAAAAQLSQPLPATSAPGSRGAQNIFTINAKILSPHFDTTFICS